jgi:hypothetical protein
MAEPSTLRRVLKICGWIALALLVIGVVVVIALHRWLHATHEPLDGRVLATTRTAYMLLAEAHPDDAEARALVAHLMSIQRDDAAIETARRILGYADRQAFAQGLLPIRMGLLVEENGARLSFVSFSRHANPVARAIREAVARRGSLQLQVGGYAIHADPQRGFAVAVQHTLLWSSDRARLEAALARIGNTAEPLPLLELLPRGSPVCAALINRQGFLQRELAHWNPDDGGPPLGEQLQQHLGLRGDDIERMTLIARVGPDTAIGTWRLQLATGSQRSHVVSGIGRFVEYLVADLIDKNLAVRHEVEDRGAGKLEVRWTIDKLRESWKTANMR